MNYADIKYPDIQDGTGIRISIYVSGCHFHCKNCHNKIAWDPNYGKKFTDETIDEIIETFRKNCEYNDGLSLLGGEPLEIYNQEGLYKLTQKFRKEFPTKDIWCWTGYDFDKDVLHKMYQENEITRKLLSNIDIIVDGTYQEDKGLVDLIARGSYNQRKIDVKASIESGNTVYLKFGDEYRYNEDKPKVFKVKEKVLSGNFDFDKGNESIKVAYIPSNIESKIDIEPEYKKVAAKTISSIRKEV